eukprot:TRINITY_DN93261_c0_g1_i1.p1 TRINITY_DN93261_c0_g1~~TRINITY_DN93261_c0_g1_i1.p1  ORF type:complete len:345 (+),score=51.72 TRINITY_DN93261_c0_g1_i1:82-1035(+)
MSANLAAMLAAPIGSRGPRRCRSRCAAPWVRFAAAGAVAVSEGSRRLLLTWRSASSSSQPRCSPGQCTDTAFVWTKPAVTLGHRYPSQDVPEGLRYCTDFVTEAEVQELMRAVEQGPWSPHLKGRRQQFFGLVYYHTQHDMPALQPGTMERQTGRPMEDLPPWLFDRIDALDVFTRRGELNQVAVNDYTERAGIGLHVEDVMSFGANLATLSLLQPIQLTLVPATEPEPTRDGIDTGSWIKVLLEPRSMLILQGESRYQYRHGIRKTKSIVMPDGSRLVRDEAYRRVSLTFRELLETRRMLDCDVSSQIQSPRLSLV